MKNDYIKKIKNNMKKTNNSSFRIKNTELYNDFIFYLLITNKI